MGVQRELYRADPVASNGTWQEARRLGDFGDSGTGSLRRPHEPFKQPYGNGHYLLSQSSVLQGASLALEDIPVSFFMQGLASLLHLPNFPHHLASDHGDRSSSAGCGAGCEQSISHAKRPDEPKPGRV